MVGKVCAWSSPVEFMIYATLLSDIKQYVANGLRMVSRFSSAMVGPHDNRSTETGPVPPRCRKRQEVFTLGRIFIGKLSPISG